MKGIGKSFYGVNVLDNVDFDLMPGEVHVLAGENGAGKSTLMKILCGIHPEYDGAMFLGGNPTSFSSPAHATGSGISMIHQELSVIPEMSVVDNIFLGREHTRLRGWVDRGAQRSKAKGILKELGIEVNPETILGTLPVSLQQMVEIAKALVFESRIIVMDEPTSALNRPEVERLFALIESLKRRKCGMVYISHKMEEIYQLADRITVLRDGSCVGTSPREDLPEAALIKWMVGRDLSQQFPPRSVPGDEARFAVENISVPDQSGYRGFVVDDVSFSVKKGEILGVGGLEGAGNHELFLALFGAYGRNPAKVRVDGKPFAVRCPGHSIASGVALLTSDRKGNGLVPGMSIVNNTTLASIPSFSPGGWMRPGRERDAAHTHHTSMRTRFSSLEQPVSDLSGGNQQKVVLAKWIETKPTVLLLDEPTRGVDVGAKKEIYDLMNKWTEAGISIILITSEMPELLAMSDRIVVMHRGRISARLTRENATQERVLSAAMGREP